MTKKEYEKKIDELQAQIDELKNTQIEEKPTPPHPRWKPEEGEYYYWFTGQGTPSQDKWVASACDRDLYNIGNIFFDLKTAEFAAERLKIIAEMREWAGTNKDGAYIYYNYAHDDILIDWDGRGYYHGDIRFHSIDDAINCVKTVGEDRIKKYYFMIPEEKE